MSTKRSRRSIVAAADEGVMVVVAVAAVVAAVVAMVAAAVAEVAISSGYP